MLTEKIKQHDGSILCQREITVFEMCCNIGCRQTSLKETFVTPSLSFNGGRRQAACASACVCLNIACPGLSSCDLLFYKVWERLDSQPAKEALSVIEDRMLRSKTTSCSEIFGRPNNYYK